MYEVYYKGIILPHKFYANFVVNNNIILELAANKSENLRYNFFRWENVFFVKLFKDNLQMKK